MTFPDRLVLFVILIAALSARMNAREAHHHTHETACHVGVVDLCHYHDKDAAE